MTDNRAEPSIIAGGNAQANSPNGLSSSQPARAEPEAAIDAASTSEQSDRTNAEKYEEFAKRYLLSKQSFSHAIQAGFSTTIFSACLWACVAVATSYRSGWVALILGYLVATSVRHFGQGIETRFRVIGLLASLAGIFVGNVLITILAIHHLFEVPLMESVELIADPQLYVSVIEAATLLDLVFYLSAGVMGWFWSAIPIGSSYAAEYARRAEAELHL